MTYTVTYGDAQTYTSAWTNCRAKGNTYISDAARLTPAIKRAIIADIDGDAERVHNMTNAMINEYWDTLSISKLERVTIRPVRVENEIEAYLRIGVDYSHARGSGEWETERVKFLRV